MGMRVNDVCTMTSLVLEWCSVIIDCMVLEWFSVVIECGMVLTCVCVCLKCVYHGGQMKPLV